MTNQTCTLCNVRCCNIGIDQKKNDGQKYIRHNFTVMGHICQVSQIFHSSEEKPSTKWWANLKTCGFGNGRQGCETYAVCTLLANNVQNQLYGSLSSPINSVQEPAENGRRTPLRAPHLHTLSSPKQLRCLIFSVDLVFVALVDLNYLQGTKTWYLYIFFALGIFFQHSCGKKHIPSISRHLHVVVFF